jgi:trafficking protein particle complex subunit 9
MEYNAFASLAHFRILLVPVGSISKKTFEQWAAEIHTLENLRLSDIPPGTKDEKGKHTLFPLRTPPR